MRNSHTIMQLKRSTDILLRILLYLASHPELERVSIQDLSTLINWNKNLVVKVAHMAVQSGLLKAVRGCTGGLSLARHPREYRIGDIIRMCEGDEPLLVCHAPPCPLLGLGCGLRGALENARENFYRELNKVTLIDLVPSFHEAESLVNFPKKIR